MKRKLWHLWINMSLLGASALFWEAGCTSYLNPESFEKTVKLQEEAGSTHVAVLSSARFDDYRDALQPAFKMTSDDALLQAIPSTLLVEDRILDAFKAALKVALPSASITRTESSTDKTGAQTERKVERVEKTEPGDLSNTTFGDSPAKDQDITKLAPKESIVTGTPTVDPMLRHLVATALYQEVQMLNRYVRDAARGNGEFDAHVVRLQVSVFPRARNLPYDVYTTISFFNGDFECGSSAIVHPKVIEKEAVHAAVNWAFMRTVGSASTVPNVDEGLLTKISTEDELIKRTDAITTSLQNLKKLSDPDAKRLRDALSAELACRLHGGNESAPQVVPLLVTDSIEAAMHSRSVDEVRQYMLAISGMFQGASFGTDLQKVDQNLRNVLSRDFNSTFTVGRVSDNTIRVRFGAIQNQNLAYTTVPQTHNITLLILVPKPAITGTVRFVSRTEFVHARTGITPTMRSTEAVRRKTRELLNDYDVDTKTLNDTQLDELAERALAYADRNDYQGFKKFVASQVPKISETESLWLDVVNSKTGGRYASGRILLQNLKTPSINLSQNPVIMDDGEKNSTVALWGVRDVASTAGLVPLVKVENKEVPATSIALTESGSRLVLSFPSLKATGFKVDSQNPPAIRVMTDTSADLFPSRVAAYQLTKVEQTKSLASVTASTKTIRSAPDGTGQVAVSCSAKEGSLILKIDGADLRSIGATGERPPAITADVGKWILAASANVDLRLANLDPATPVTISVTSGKDAEGATPAKVTFTVAPTPPPEKK